MRVRPLPRNFASGELAPWMDGIQNESTARGMRIVENFFIKKQGQAVRRPGSFFVKEVKNSANATTILPLTIDDDNRYVLELGDAYIRFFDVSIHAVLGAPYELTSPWSSAQLGDLRSFYYPEEKALYIWHSLYNTRRIVWTSSTSWAIEPVPFLQSRNPVAIDAYGRLAQSDDLRHWIETRIDIAVQSHTLFSTIARTAKGKLIVGDENPVMAIGDENAENWEDLGFNVVDGGGFAVITSDANELVLVQQGNGYASSGLLYVSFDDGVSWINRETNAAAYLRAAAKDIATQHWMAVGFGMRRYTTSIDRAWVSITETATIEGLGFGNNLWIAACHSAMRYTGSVAGVWSSIAISGVMFDVEYGTPGGSPLWVTVGQSISGSGTARIFTSPTGSAWTLRYDSASVARNFNFVKWIGTMWIAGGGPNLDPNNSGTIWVTSYDGTTWTIDTTLSRADYGAWQDMAFYLEPNILDLNLSPNYPKLGTYHEGRAIMVPASKLSTLYGSKIGRPNNFYLGELANQAFSYGLVSERNVDIQWLMGGFGGIVVGTRTAEGIMIGSPDEGITPQTAQFKWLSTFGSAFIQPVRINDTIVFVQRGGEIIRGYQPVQGAWQSPDLTAFADHIADGGVTQLEHQDDPQTMLYAVRSDGQLLALSMDNGMRAWSRFKMAGTLGGNAIVESVAVVPTSGAEDEIWMVVKRIIGGATKRYIEYLDTQAVESFAAAHYLDSGVYLTSGTTFANIGGLTHLAGENVDALIGGTRWVQSISVPASGTINVAPYSGTDIHVGLPYDSYLQTLRTDFGSEWGSGAGLNRHTHKLWVWVHDSSALTYFGPTSATIDEVMVYPSSVTLNTAICEVNFPGQSDRDNYIWIKVSDPRPLTIVALLADSTEGDM